MKINNTKTLVGTPEEFKSLQGRLACLYYSAPVQEVRELYRRSWEALEDGFIDVSDLDEALVAKLLDKAFTEYDLMCYCRYMCKKNKLNVVKAQRTDSTTECEEFEEKLDENIPASCKMSCKGCARAEMLKNKENE